MKHRVLDSYKPAAFWSFNDDLKEHELTKQLEEQSKAGLAGGFLHSRVGLVTEYMSEEWLEAVKHCCKEAERLHSSLWLYDEDKFPSGYAGGLVLKEDSSLASKVLCMMPYDKINDAEVLKVYKTITYDEKKYALALVRMKFGNPWFGGKCYVDFLNPKTIEVFLNSTHEVYKNYLGEYFGNVIRGVFSDEFCYTQKAIAWPSVPFSDDLERVFLEKKGYDLVDCMEKLFLDEGDYHRIRRDFYEFVTNRFRDCFTKPYNKWCQKNGLIFTGHLMNEDFLTNQTEWIGAAMPHYMDMDMPGIDKLGLDLSNRMLIKQLTSVTEQMGKRALCETFGCAGQQAGPQILKQIADWLCVQGITFLNPHLILYSMRGERKRDCPPNISWLQPWFENSTGLFEHMARVCEFVYESKEQVELLVLHPIQSVWAEFSPLHKVSPTYSIWAEKNPYAGMNYITETETYEKPFMDLSEQLTKASLGYHYGDEIVMEELGVFDEGIQIGNGHYQIVIIPPVSVLQQNTLQLLKALADTNGKQSVIFIGRLPECVPEKWYECFTIAKNVSEAVSMASLRATRRVEITNEISGKIADKVLFRYGVTNDGKEVFFAANTAPKRSFETIIRVPFLPMALDTVTGKYYDVQCEKTDAGYCCRVKFDIGGSVMLVSKGNEEVALTSYLQSGVWLERNERVLTTVIPLATLLEDNLLPLDVVNFTSQGQTMEQRPLESLWQTVFYRLPEGTPFSAEYSFYVKQCPEKSPVALIEMARNLTDVKVNGVSVEVIAGSGSHKCFDESYDRIILDNLHIGKNTITIEGEKCNNIIGVGNHCAVPSGEEHHPTELETIFICGDFGVWKKQNDTYEIGVRPQNIAGSVTKSAHPFYGGGIKTAVEIPASDKYRIICVEADAQSAKLIVNGEHIADAYVGPFTFRVPPVDEVQKAEIILYNSMTNVFGPLHLAEREQLDMVGPALMVDMSRYTKDSVLFEYGLWSISILEEDTKGEK